MSDVVEAAGGLVIEGDRLAIVHRPHRGDWSLPKGHLDPGEDHEHTALREVWEETGLRCRITAPAGSTSYIDRKGRPKRVLYYLMEVESGAFTVNNEVDELRWITVDELSELSYPADAELVAANWPKG